MDREGEKFYIAVVYMAPDFGSAKEANQNLLDELSEDIYFFREQGRICIVGDFNCRIGELSSKIERESEGEGEEIIYKRKSQDKKVNSAGRNFLKFMNDHNLIILNGIGRKAPFTSVQVRGCSVIDYIITDQEVYEKLKKFKTWEEVFSILSDHRFLSIEIKGELIEKKARKMEEREGKEEGGEGREGREGRGMEKKNNRYKKNGEYLQYRNEKMGGRVWRARLSKL
jgi:hypothetical protein